MSLFQIYRQIDTRRYILIAAAIVVRKAYCCGQQARSFVTGMSDVEIGRLKIMCDRLWV